MNRADCVIDLMPYETRGVLMPSGFGPPPERFSRERWVVADICSHEPWPFDDDFFDFAVCTFTLEDEGSLPARERPAIDDYPFAELELVIDQWFHRSAARRRALELIDRAQRTAARLMPRRG